MDWPPRLAQRRESIEDHLATARARFPELQDSRSCGSRGLVRDLIRRGFIGKTTRVYKMSGTGWGQRFTPADYRALIEILRLRAQGHIHRSRWSVWLWLRGRDYPIADVRAAINRELSSMLDEVRAQLNPSGRATRPFHESYKRNVAPRLIDSPFPSFAGTETLLAALMFRPREVADMTIDLTGIASAGMIDDGRGRSAITVALATASDEQLQRARREIQRLRSGELEREIADVVRRNPSADRDLLDFVAAWASQQRAIHRGNPAMAAYLVGIYVLHDDNPIPVPEYQGVSANKLLSYLRGQGAKNES